jgi:ankyrin repeat protein
LLYDLFSVEAVTTLLELGAPVNVHNSLTGATPLHMVTQSHKATNEQKLSVVQILIDHGADLGRPDNYGSLPVDCLPPDSPLLTLLQPKLTLLYKSIQERAFDDFEREIAQPDALTTTYKSQTPLQFALNQLEEAFDAQNEQDMIILTRMCSLLLHNTTCDEFVTNQQRQPLELVLTILRQQYKSQSTDTADYEQLAIQLNTLDTSNKPVNILHDTARRGELQMLTFILERLAWPVNAPNRQGMTALHFAARSNQDQVVEYLLKQDEININALDNQGQTPMEAAQLNGHEKITAILEGWSK